MQKNLLCLYVVQQHCLFEEKREKAYRQTGTDTHRGERETEGQTYRDTEKKTDRQTYRQTESET